MAGILSRASAGRENHPQAGNINIHTMASTLRMMQRYSFSRWQQQHTRCRRCEHCGHGCRFGPVCMGVLYHISMDDSHKSLFVYTEPPAMAVLYDRLLAVPDVRREPELIALAVNLTQNARCAAALVEGPKFDRLMKRAMDRRDDLLFKVMRNVSQVRLAGCVPGAPAERAPRVSALAPRFQHQQWVWVGARKGRSIKHDDRPCHW